MKKTVAVLGAGSIGVSCALELQRRGWDVVLIDKLPPGRETSYGNAGVFARSSLVPLNNPALWASLPKYLLNNSAQLRYKPGFMLRNLSWACNFLLHTRHSSFKVTTTALDSLIKLSLATHRRWLVEAGASFRLRSTGWIHVYRSEVGFARSQLARQAYEKFEIDTQVLSPEALRELEPALRPIFPHAIWVKDAASVDNPGQVVQAYADLFVALGGRLLTAGIEHVMPSPTGWSVHAGQAAPLTVEHLVVALGPWSKTFLQQQLGLSVPMAYERGYHMHYAREGASSLTRPIYDSGGGYVLSPMEMGMRLTSGVELTDFDAPKNGAQLAMAEAAARQAVPLGERLESEPWLGRRPTMPDSRPVIGGAKSHPRLWMAFGHHHIGLSTGPGTGVLLADVMSQEAPHIDATPFAPGRFGL